MGRGRSIDNRLPLTRSLIIQRAYRAQKSAKVKHLEEESARLTAENTALRAEIGYLQDRIGGASSHSLSSRTVLDAARRELENALGRLNEAKRMARGTQITLLGDTFAQSHPLSRQTPPRPPHTAANDQSVRASSDSPQVTMSSLIPTSNPTSNARPLDGTPPPAGQYRPYTPQSQQRLLLLIVDRSLPLSP
ncbi:hypothetical protein EHS25_005647 [Saitozyma podzolica]|uniref:BZIP domain-containing protein n=1 Tax=Saitozyma podzolica TaxID=1890683 RepID=A0A427XVL1_9TREE|nr:hypothetical protein EHS25_005647 [Saitozyma podzolica]